MTSPMGERPAMLSITESSGNLEGLLTTRMGTATVSGYADGNSIKFSAQVQGPMAAMTLEFSGTVDGDEASGVMQSGSTGSGRWSGSRTTGEEGIHAVAAASHATQDGPSSVVGGPPGSTMHGGVGHTSGMPGTAGRAPGPGLEILRSPAALKRTFSSLGEPSYRNLWIGFLLSMGGMQMQMLARGFFIYHLTGSPALLGVVTAATAVPVLALALFGGVLADRGDKKRIIQAGQVVSLILVLVIAVSITTGTITWQHLLAASLVQGAVMPLIMPARQAIIPQLVGRDRLMNAVALNSMGMGLTTMIAPAIAGGLIAAVGIGAVYYVMAGMYAGALFFTGLLPRLETPSRGASASVLGDIRDGFRYLFSNRVILLLILLSFATMFLAMPVRFILPIFAKDVFLVGPGGLGSMQTAMGVGALGGALFIASLGKVARRGFALAASGIVSGSVLLGFAAMAYLAPVYLAALGFMVLVGLIQTVRMTLTQSLMMEYTDQEYRGRMMSLMLVGLGLMPLGVLPVTLMADRIGAPLALAIMATILILVAGTIFVASPRLRRLE